MPRTATLAARFFGFSFACFLVLAVLSSLSLSMFREGLSDNGADLYSARYFKLLHNLHQDELL